MRKGRSIRRRLPSTGGKGFRDPSGGCGSCRGPAGGARDRGWFAALRVPAGTPARYRHTVLMRRVRCPNRFATCIRKVGGAWFGQFGQDTSPIDAGLKHGLCLIDQSAVGPDGVGGKFEMLHGAATMARGIAAAHRAEDAAAGGRGGDQLASVLQALFGGRCQHSEVSDFGWRGSGPTHDLAHPAEPAHPVGAFGVRARREEERALQVRFFAGFFPPRPFRRRLPRADRWKARGTG